MATSLLSLVYDALTTDSRWEKLSRNFDANVSESLEADWLFPLHHMHSNVEPRSTIYLLETYQS